MNRVLAVLVAAGVAAAATMPFVTLAPNRLVRGTGVSLASLLPTAGAGAIVALALPAAVLAACAAAGGATGERRAVHAVAALAAGALAPLMLALAAQAPLPDGAAALARIGLGGAFWVLEALALMALADALQRLRAPLALRVLGPLAAALPVAWMAAAGTLDGLALMKEFANRREVFIEALGRHVQIVAVTLVPTLLLGLPIGVAAARRARLGAALFSVLNVLQTIPSIALFGLLLGPLAWLAGALPSLARLGISGVGLAPAVIALTLYSLLPVARSTAAGLRQVSPAVLEAARGMGLSRRQVFWSVEVPLALPLLVAGLRVTTVQAIGLVVVAALIGAGGLGSLVFQGLLSSAIDLVLLGVLPVIGLALATDAAFALLARAVAGPAG